MDDLLRPEDNESPVHLSERERSKILEQNSSDDDDDDNELETETFEFEASELDRFDDEVDTPNHAPKFKHVGSSSSDAKVQSSLPKKVPSPPKSHMIESDSKSSESKLSISPAKSGRPSAFDLRQQLRLSRLAQDSSECVRPPKKNSSKKAQPHCGGPPVRVEATQVPGPMFKVPASPLPIKSQPIEPFLPQTFHLPPPPIPPVPMGPPVNRNFHVPVRPIDHRGSEWRVQAKSTQPLSLHHPGTAFQGPTTYISVDPMAPPRGELETADIPTVNDQSDEAKFQDEPEDEDEIVVLKEYPNEMGITPKQEKPDVKPTDLTSAEFSRPGSAILRPPSEIEVIMLSDDDDENYMNVDEDIQIKMEDQELPAHPSPHVHKSGRLIVTEEPSQLMPVETTNMPLCERITTNTLKRRDEISLAEPPPDYADYRGSIKRKKFQKTLRNKDQIIKRFKSQIPVLNRVVVMTNLPPSWDYESLNQKAAAYGKVTSVHCDWSENRAVIAFELEKDAAMCCDRFDNRLVNDGENNATTIHAYIDTDKAHGLWSGEI